MEAIVIAGEAINVPQREGEQHWKALLRKEQGRIVTNGVSLR
jgi:hypothetical protein